MIVEDLKKQLSILGEDYSHGLLHLVWLEDEKSRKLIFSEIELYPKYAYEIEESIGCEHSLPDLNRNLDPREQCLKLHSGKFICYIRIKKTVGELCNLYIECIERQRMSMDWIQGEQASCLMRPLAQDRLLSKWALTARICSEDINFYTWSYIAQAWGMVRSNHLFPSAEVEDCVKNSLVMEESAQWLHDRIGWNISENEALWGSVHLTLPNPLYRYLNCKQQPGNVGDPDSVLYSVEKHHPDIEAALMLQPFEKREAGLIALPSVSLELKAGSSISEVAICLSGKSQQLSCFVYSNRHGLLDYKPFVSFLKSINVNISVARNERINIPSEEGVESVSRTTLQECSVIELGEPNPHISNRDKALARYHSDRVSHIRAEKQGQLWLDNPDEARSALCRIFANAHSLCIIDPYFSRKEFIDYIVKVCPKGAKISIVTSMRGLAQKGQNRKNCDRDLRAFFAPLKEHFNWEVQLYLMIGKHPAIHDRFIIVDDATVWLSGSSLNYIGNRSCILVQLHDPKSIINKINSILKNEKAVNRL